MFKKHPLAGLKLTLYPIRNNKMDEAKTNNALRHQIQALRVRVTDLEGALKEARDILVLTTLLDKSGQTNRAVDMIDGIL